MKNLELKYNSDKILSFPTKNCAILWANWAWKSSFSRKLLALNNDKNIIQPISAQRNLIFNQGSLKWVQDTELLFSSFWFSGPKIGKWNSRHIWHFFEKDSYNNIMQDDFNENLEILFRDDNNAHSDASRNHKKWKFKKPITKADEIFNIWNKIFINKQIKIVEWKIRVFFYKTKKDVVNYEIENLSDWERSALYLITKCIYAPNNWIILVDEWETHLNPALLHDLWDSIEESRQDCNFIYISHSIDFIISRNDCTKFWIKNFNHPEDWEIEEIQNDKLPEELIFQILWSKKEKILFVESEEDKDKLLYQKIYIDFKVIPVGSCENVINFTKALNNNITQNYNKNYFWLIDRDFRTNENLKSLEKKHIFSLPVAEFENLFFREEIIKFVFEFLWKQDDFQKNFENFKNSIFSLKTDLKFKTDFYKDYIQQKFNQNLKKFKLEDKFVFQDNYEDVNIFWQKIENETDYNTFLLVLNSKWALKWKTNKLKLLNFWWNEYQEQLFCIFNTENVKDLRSEFLKFMPNLI